MNGVKTFLDYIKSNETNKETRSRYVFDLSYKTEYDDLMITANPSHTLFILDKEDIEYFKNKYSKIRKKHIEKEIKALKEEQSKL